MVEALGVSKQCMAEANDFESLEHGMRKEARGAASTGARIQEARMLGRGLGVKAPRVAGLLVCK